jgi:transposase-like protein
MRCLHCESDNTIKHSFYKGVQRHKCKDCKRTFSPSTYNTTYFLKKKDTYISFVELMDKGKFYTLNEIQKELKISRQTAFDWRHRYFKSLKIESKRLNGFIEVDDVNFNFSNKGNRHFKGNYYTRRRGGIKKAGDHKYNTKLLVVFGRNGKDVNITLNRMGRMSSDDFGRGLENIVSKKCIIVSDAHPSLRNYTEKAGLEHKVFRANEGHGKGDVHVNNINNISMRLNTLINDQHRGVATKYLQGYVNWFVYLHYKKMKNVETVKKSWINYVLNENQYKSLIKDKSNIRFDFWNKKFRKSELWLN